MNIRAVGKGGIPEDPTAFLRSPTIWSDLRWENSHSNERSDRANYQPSSIELLQSPIEAKEWKFNTKGNIELVASQGSDQHNFPIADYLLPNKQSQ